MSISHLPPHTEAESGPGAEVIALFGDPVTTGARPRVRRLRWAGFALVGCGLALLPWLFVLANDLPATATAAHWSLAWVGLDTLEALGLITTGLLATRRDPRRALAATATATLLVVDAWFDLTTAGRGGDFTSAVAMAAGAEVPLAALCVAMAMRALPRP
jgi:hypothetical protein